MSTEPPLEDDPKHIPRTSAHFRPRNLLSWLYLQYLIVSGLYMLERWERVIVNVLLLTFLGMAGYSTYRFVPGNVRLVYDMAVSGFSSAYSGIAGGQSGARDL